MSSIYATIGKRILDVSFSAAGLLLTLPIIAVTALLIRVTLGTPVLFAQERPGFRGRPFVLFKFRSMTGARGRGGEPLPDEARLTGFGEWLRRLSLDERAGVRRVAFVCDDGREKQGTQLMGYPVGGARSCSPAATLPARAWSASAIMRRA